MMGRISNNPVFPGGPSAERALLLHLAYTVSRAVGDGEPEPDWMPALRYLMDVVRGGDA